MIVDITNEILTDIKTTLDDVTVLSSYQFTTPSFPTVTVEELDNSAYVMTKDSSGFKHSQISFRIEIYTTGNKKMTEAKEIRNSIDKIMSDKYGFTRGIPRVIPNYLDNTIYRYSLSYSGLIDENKNIFRG